MSVLDASVMIALLDADDAHHARATELIEAAIRADDTLACSVITRAEVLVGPTRRGEDDRARRLLNDLGVITLAIPPDAATRLAKWRAETGVKMPDCCVLLAQADQPYGSLMTFDDRLAKAAVHLGMSVAGVAP
jgi:predicted nucleic acid-binding protein